MQSDQSLCQSLEYSMTVMLLTEYHLEFLGLKKEAAQALLSQHLSKCHAGNPMSWLIIIYKKSYYIVGTP